MRKWINLNMMIDTDGRPKEDPCEEENGMRMVDLAERDFHVGYRELEHNYMHKYTRVNRDIEEEPESSGVGKEGCSNMCI